MTHAATLLLHVLSKFPRGSLVGIRELRGAGLRDSELIKAIPELAQLDIASPHNADFKVSSPSAKDYHDTSKWLAIPGWPNWVVGVAIRNSYKGKLSHMQTLAPACDVTMNLGTPALARAFASMVLSKIPNAKVTIEDRKVKVSHDDKDTAQVYSLASRVTRSHGRAMASGGAPKTEAVQAKTLKPGDQIIGAHGRDTVVRVDRVGIAYTKSGNALKPSGTVQKIVGGASMAAAPKSFRSTFSTPKAAQEFVKYFEMKYGLTGEVAGSSVLYKSTSNRGEDYKSILAQEAKKRGGSVGASIAAAALKGTPYKKTLATTAQAKALIAAVSKASNGRLKGEWDGNRSVTFRVFNDADKRVINEAKV